MAMAMAIDAAGLGMMASGPKMTAARVTGTAGATARMSSSSSSSSSVVDDIVLIDVRIRTTSLTIITAMALVKAMGARTHPTRSTNAWRTATSPAPATAAAAAAAVEQQLLQRCFCGLQGHERFSNEPYRRSG